MAYVCALGHPLGYESIDKLFNLKGVFCKQCDCITAYLLKDHVSTDRALAEIGSDHKVTEERCMNGEFTILIEFVRNGEEQKNYWRIPGTILPNGELVYYPSDLPKKDLNST
jgi:hypothetical protein